MTDSDYLMKHVARVTAYGTGLAPLQRTCPAAEDRRLFVRWRFAMGSSQPSDDASRAFSDRDGRLSPRRMLPLGGSWLSDNASVAAFDAGSASVNVSTCSGETGLDFMLTHSQRLIR